MVETSGETGIGAGYMQTAHTGSGLQLLPDGTNFNTFRDNCFVSNNDGGNSITLGAWYIAKLIKNGTNYTFQIYKGSSLIRTIGISYTDSTNYFGISTGWRDGHVTYFKNVKVIKS
jgi:hypothetical protein